MQHSTYEVSVTALLKYFNISIVNVMNTTITRCTKPNFTFIFYLLWGTTDPYIKHCSNVKHRLQTNTLWNKMARGVMGQEDNGAQANYCTRLKTISEHISALHEHGGALTSSKC